MRNIAVLSSCLVFCCILQACASVNFDIPTNRFLTPENSGDSLSGRFGVSAGSASKIILVRDPYVADPVKREKDIRRSDQIDFDLEISAIKRLDLFYNGMGLGAKAQIIGADVKTAKEGNFSLAASIAGSNGTDKETEEYDGTSDDFDAEVKYNWIDYALIAGYRPQDSVLIYASIGMTSADAHADFTVGKTRHYELEESSGVTKTFHLGLQVNSERFYFIVEPGYAISSWEDAKDYGYFVYGAAAGIKW